jgi:hypothetical protein
VVVEHQVPLNQIQQVVEQVEVEILVVEQVQQVETMEVDLQELQIQVELVVQV